MKKTVSLRTAFVHRLPRHGVACSTEQTKQINKFLATEAEHGRTHRKQIAKMQIKNDFLRVGSWIDYHILQAIGTTNPRT